VPLQPLALVQGAAGAAAPTAASTGRQVSREATEPVARQSCRRQA
jgi:hypothetical protein